MGIMYHKNAKTTIHTRRQIKESSETIEALAKRLCLNKNTILKWKNREELEDIKLCASQS